MQLPDIVQRMIEHELARLAANSDFDLHPQRRREITEALGPMGESGVDTMLGYQDTGDECRLPNLTTADRVRARIALQAAEKVLPLWEIACAETDYFSKNRRRIWPELDDLLPYDHDIEDIDDTEDVDEEDLSEEEYMRQMAERPIWDISVYDAPRAFIPSHILRMAEVGLRRDVDNCAAFAREVNECHELYGRPEYRWREYSIKWAAQEALYTAVRWQKYLDESNQEVDIGDDVAMANIHNHGPSGEALLAYACVFEEGDFWFDREKRREFWRWWLEEAIPSAWASEHTRPES